MNLLSASIESKHERRFGRASILHSVHKILSVAVGSTLTATKVFVRASSDPNDAHDLIRRFVNELVTIGELFEANLPSFFSSGLTKLENDISELEGQNPKRSKLQNLKHRLTSLMKLQVYGYNSGSYDITVIIGYLVNELKSIEMTANSIKVIKKARNYFMISCQDFVLKDMMNFGPPVSLSKFFKMWGVSERKSIWPYTYFDSIEQIKTCSEFPDRAAFYNDLKEVEMNETDYNEAKTEFYRRKNLPENDPDKIYNMQCWLKHYNALDVSPFIKAISTCFRTFFETFKKDPSCFNSLPSLALETALGLYCQDSPTAWSFKPSMNHTRKLFRHNILGGLGNLLNFKSC